ncbi:D-serine ammonia-lyase [Neptunomonas antarctica]|uniref:Probable D-serine dehydratase n=1 Tax=Neptunomonas antarctica TaxID=619304 RepID=A0A1N7KBY1_9GAMM|nr:D-serine ammonia-lyase [Neptunomonas antarctica]SIS59107.1 D-serine ammonia-lyase [Neptunomonas antarctica]
MTPLFDPALKEQLSTAASFLWLNPAYRSKMDKTRQPLSIDDIKSADLRLHRFAPLLQKLFPELQQSHGLIESELQAIPNMQHAVFPELPGKLMIKADHALPVAGSIKARGGIYEVLCHCESLALKHSILSSTEDNYLKLIDTDAREIFSRYKIAVSSTGNLGLSIGIISSALGFNATVHMSAEAKDWKKKRLRERGVSVIEHSDDYSAAVTAGRQQSEADPLSYFIDDENSSQLFTGYAVAALRLKEQLKAQQVAVDAEHPLFVYLPCGVGGAPGGITFGLKQIFGPYVHCFFAEPVQAPCVLIGLQADSEETLLSVYDVGLTVTTEADGLAVSKASAWVCSVIKNILSGVFTVEDNSLFRHLYQLYLHENITLEPSAAAGFSGPEHIIQSETGRRYLEQENLLGHLDKATHLIWTTGGLFVPPEEMKKSQHYGQQLIENNN